MKKLKQKIKNWIYQKAIKIFAKRIVNGQNRLTPEYLLERGWIKEGHFFVEPNVKDRDKIWIEFECYYSCRWHRYYRVFHGPARNFIAQESTVEWFELYYLCVDTNERYLFAKI